MPPPPTTTKRMQSGGSRRFFFFTETFAALLLLSGLSIGLNKLNAPSMDQEKMPMSLLFQQKIAEKHCGQPRPPVAHRNRAGVQYLTPGHRNCTLGWDDPQSVNFGQNLEDAVIFTRFFQANSPLAHLGGNNGVDYNTTKSERGIFLEMGALDGIAISNTLMFEQCLGWDGILIEAQPDNFKKLQENRPCSLTLGEGVCAQKEGGTIYMSGSEGTAFDLGTRASGDNDTAGAFEVPCRPLTSILSGLGVTRINFFSLDVEGAELKVLETIDWEAVQIDVLMVETEFINNQSPNKKFEMNNKIQAVRNLVEKKGGMHRVPSRLDREDPETNKLPDPRVCERTRTNNCLYLSIAGSDVFVSDELYKYDTEPWLFD